MAPVKKSRKIPFVLLCFVLLLAAVFAYSSLSKRGENVSYLTEPVRRGDIRKTVSASGEVDAVQLINVGAQASGQIVKLYVALGQVVRQGDMIAEIDSTKQTNDLNSNRAKLESLRAQLAAKQIALKVAKAQFDRESLLKKSESTSRQSLDNAENVYSAARSAVTDLESQIVQTQIAVNTAETNLGYTKITAPSDGTVVSVPVVQGQTVNAVQVTPTIVQIADLSRMEIQIEIAEGDITKIRPGMEVEYTILSEPGAVFKTALTSIDPGPSALSDGTYKKTAGSAAAVYYYANALVDNKDGRLRIGMTTQNTISVAHADNILMVPSIAIQTRDGKSYVQVLHGAKEGKGLLGSGPSVPTVEERAVETGLSDNMNTEITSGLKEGERVITTQMSQAEMQSAPTPRMPGPRRL